jgi:hypothetical protein
MRPHDHQFLSPEQQRLIQEPLSEPPARARGHWKPLREAMEKLDGLRAQQATFDAEIARLDEVLVRARLQDQQSLGRALANGEPDPEPQAPALEAEIGRHRERSAAMLGAILEERRRVASLVLRLKSGWAGDLERHLADKAAAYRAAIVATEAARADLIAEVQTGAWLSAFPDPGGSVQTHALPGDQDPDTPVDGPRFAEVLAALLRDAEQLPSRGPVRPTAAYMRWLVKKQIVVERVDDDGRHPEPLRARLRLF